MRDEDLEALSADIENERRDELDALLRYSMMRGPSTPEGKAARQAAEAGFLRVAKYLLKRSKGLKGDLKKELERAANEKFYRAVLAANLEEIHAAAARYRAPEVLDPRDPRPQAAALGPQPPSSVTAIPLNATTASVTWVPTPVIGLVPTGYRIETLGPAAPATFDVGVTTSTTVGSLQNGGTYRFNVSALFDPGDQVSAPAQSNEITLANTPPAPNWNPVFPSAPPISVLDLDAASEAARDLVADAARTGSKWRYEYLRAQAVKAAGDALQYETYLASLMSMTIAKGAAAQQLFNPVMLDAIARLEDINEAVADAGADPAFLDIIDSLADTGTQSLLLARVITWLVENSPIGFWVGLFEALVHDLAEVVPIIGDFDFDHVEEYLDDVFNSGDVGTAVKAIARELRNRVDSEAERIVAPIKDAVAAVVDGVRQAMAEVFESFDLPLTMGRPANSTQAEIPNFDPLAALTAQLENVVNDLAKQIATKLEERLSEITGGNSRLFKIIVVTYLCLPILAFLVISLLGGPFSAALLVAAVLLAAEELVRLLLRLLGGPILRKVDELKRELVTLVDRVKAAFAKQAELIRNRNPDQILKMLASELRELRALVPQPFLDDAAGLLEEARDVVLRSAHTLALAAEQALGMENGTVFDAIALRYHALLTPAPQLPGGADASRLAAAGLLRDLGRLEQQRTGVQDGKEVEVTHRVSLARVLGPSFATFLSRREAVVHVTEADLLDRTMPGMYRALIKDVRLVGKVGALPAFDAGVPVSLTHLGESRTRIRRRANPAAPPIDLPLCAQMTEAEFVNAATDFERMRARIFDTLTMWIPMRWMWNFPPIRVRFIQGLAHHSIGILPAKIAEWVAEAACGLVDPNPVKAVLDKWVPTFDFGAVANVAYDQDDMTPREQMAITLAAAMTAFMYTPLRSAYRDAIAEQRRDGGKWSNVRLEEDPDPAVRALGFATLVRELPIETQMFQLFGAGSPSDLRLAPPITTNDGAPFAPPSVLQYRAFENRGLDGKFVIRLEPLDRLGLSPLTALTDVILEITTRACYDADLAAAVRQSNSATKAALELVNTAMPIITSVVFPGSARKTDTSVGERRTIHLSWRAQRDKAYDIWFAANAASIAPPLPLGTATKLPRDAAFVSLGPAATTFSVVFDDVTPPDPNAALLALPNRVQLTKQALGVLDLPQVGTLLATPRIVSLGIGVIPMREGVRRVNETDDPLGVTISAPQLASLLPPIVHSKRLQMTEVTTPPLVTLASAFSANAAIDISVGRDALAMGRLYDVIVSITYEAPMIESPTALATLN